MTPRLIAKRAEQLNFCLVAVKVVRCFKIKRQVIKNGMSDYSFHGVKPNIAFTYAFVSILMTAERIFTVIYMYGSKLFKAYYSVKIRKHLVKRVYNIVAASKTWHVSRHTPTFSLNSIRSSISRSSSKLLPTSVPFPAMVSKSTVVVCPFVNILLS